MPKPPKRKCIACEGTGKSSIGHNCVPCGGTGYKKPKTRINKNHGLSKSKRKVSKKYRSQEKSECEKTRGKKFGVKISKNSGQVKKHKKSKSQRVID